MSQAMTVAVAFALLFLVDGVSAFARERDPGTIEVVATTDALKAYKSPSGYVLREGFREPGDGGHAFYGHDASRCPRPDDGTQIPAADGGCWRVDTATPISPALFGARCKGKAFDDTIAIQAALDTGRAVQFSDLGTACTVTKPLILKTPGQLVAGKDRTQTSLQVSAGFSGPGVFVFQTGEPGPVVRDLSVAFEQPSDDQSTSLAALHIYPPAFFARATPRFELQHVGCYAATTCIDMTGNSGGATIDDFQMSAFENGIIIDGALDTIRLLEIHAWPFRATPKQLRIMLDNVTWVNVAKADDFKVVGGLFLGGKVGFAFHASASGVATGSMTNVDFDGEHIAITMSAGNISVTGGYVAAGLPGSQDVAITGGTLGVFGATIGCADTPATTNIPTISVSGALTNLTIVGSPSMICMGMQASILAASGGTIIFSDNLILVTPSVPYARPRLDIGANARITAMGNRMGDKGAGAGTFIAIDKDNFNRVIGNAAPGWTYKLAGRPMPVSPLVAGPGLYFGN